MEKNDHESARPILEELVGRKQSLVTLRSKATLGKCLLKLGRAPEAAKYWDDVLAASADPIMINGVLLDKLSVGQDLFAKGDYAGARGVFEGMVPVGVARLGTDHQTVFLARMWLAFTFDKLSLLADACVSFEEALSLRDRVSGPEHPDTVAVAFSLFLARWRLGQIDACHAIFVRYFLWFCRQDPQSLTGQQQNILAAIKQTSWLQS
jgi:hypothetical protein